MTKSRLAATLVLTALVGVVIAAETTEKKDITFTPAQQAAIDKIQAHGGLVLRVASNSDDLDILFNLSGKEGTDGVVGQVKLLPKVTKLNLAGTDITDKGLAQIAGLADVTHLHLEKSKVTDAGLAHLKGMAKLEYLNLYATEVGDNGLDQLKGLKNLKKIYLWQTKVTDKGAADLSKAIAGIYINRGWEEPKEAPKEVKPVATTPDKPGELTIKAIMEKAHKGDPKKDDDTILKRALAKKSNPAELKELLGYYQSLAAMKPKKGDEKSWKDKSTALVAAGELVVKGDDKGIAALKAASDCKACHTVHK
ncbi:MAG: hypothetical protein WD768_07075 [Phycisphaeraceae bacterium]